MMTREEIFQSIEAAVVTRADLITAQQDGFRGLAGDFFQGLPTHSEPPADGAQVAPDRLSDHPTDQPVAWTAFKGLPETMMSSLRCDTYDGPAGAGYVLTLEVEIAGVLWRKSFNFGPEEWRAAGWAQSMTT
jgi:hypothetical protein